jgi:hypothetical protein
MGLVGDHLNVMQEGYPFRPGNPIDQWIEFGASRGGGGLKTSQRDGLSPSFVVPTGRMTR